MSTAKLANLKFTTSASIRVAMETTDNLVITTANSYANAVRSYSKGFAANVYYDRSNTQYYFSPTGNSNFNHVDVDSMGMSLTRPASDSGLSCYAIWAGDRPFVASAGGSSAWGVRTGRGTWGNPMVTKSLDRFTHFNNPAESAEPIDFGLYYQVGFALYANGNLYTWGINGQGQCGLGHTTDTTVPTLAATNVTNVYHHPSMNNYDASSKMIIKKTDGYLYAAGYNSQGQLGVGDTTNRSSFTIIPNSFNAISVWNLGCGAGALVIQTDDYRILACGYNASGQLGTGDTTNRNYLVDVTTKWGGAADSGIEIVKVICGLGYVDTAYDGRSWIGILLSDGTFRLAGNNSWGTLGLGTTGNSNYSTPIKLSISSQYRIVDVAGIGGGPGTIMCLYENGNLYNWGHNTYGQLGIGNATSTGVINLVTTGVDKIFCDGHDQSSYGYRQSAFYRKNGLLYGTGYNEHGELGNGTTTTPITSWTLMDLPQDFVCDSIGLCATTSAGVIHIFFGTDGRMFATGYNAHSMVSWNTTTNALAPIHITPALGG